MAFAVAAIVLFLFIVIACPPAPLKAPLGHVKPWALFIIYMLFSVTIRDGHA